VVATLQAHYYRSLAALRWLRHEIGNPWVRGMRSRDEIQINASTFIRDVGVFDVKPESMQPRGVRTDCYYGRDPTTYLVTVRYVASDSPSQAPEVLSAEALYNEIPAAKHTTTQRRIRVPDSSIDPGFTSRQSSSDCYRVQNANTPHCAPSTSKRGLVPHIGAAGNALSRYARAPVSGR
jgi:hypothetical protein